jgi:hypothetical protein
VVHAAGRRPDGADRGDGGEGLAARHLLHLQPRRVRARDAGRADGRPVAHLSRAAPRRWPRTRRSGSRR